VYRVRNVKQINTTDGSAQRKREYMCNDEMSTGAHGSERREPSIWGNNKWNENEGEVKLLKYGVPHRNHTRSDRAEHRRRRVRIGRVQLTLYKIGQQHGHTAVLMIQGTQNPDTGCFAPATSRTYIVFSCPSRHPKHSVGLYEWEWVFWRVSSRFPDLLRMASCGRNCLVKKNVVAWKL
jgi:hypothetical protein